MFVVTGEYDREGLRSNKMMVEVLIFPVVNMDSEETGEEEHF